MTLLHFHKIVYDLYNAVYDLSLFYGTNPQFAGSPGKPHRYQRADHSEMWKKLEWGTLHDTTRYHGSSLSTS